MIYLEFYKKYKDILEKINNYIDKYIFNGNHIPIEFSLINKYDGSVCGQNMTSKIVIYPEPFINQFGGNEYILISRLVYVCLHEAFHELQYVDMILYSNDEKYRSSIESSIDLTTIFYLNENKKLLEYEIGYKIYCDYSLNDFKNIYNKNEISISPTHANIGLSMFKRYIYSNTLDYTSTLDELYLSNKDITFIYGNLQVPIKMNGKFKQDGMFWLINNGYIPSNRNVYELEFRQYGESLMIEFKLKGLNKIIEFI